MPCPPLHSDLNGSGAFFDEEGEVDQADAAVGLDDLEAAGLVRKAVAEDRPLDQAVERLLGRAGLDLVEEGHRVEHRRAGLLDRAAHRVERQRGRRNAARSRRAPAPRALIGASCHFFASSSCLKPPGIGERRLEDLRVERGDARIGEHQDVVRLDVQAAKAEVGGAGEHLERHAGAAGDEHLVMLQAAEVGAAHAVGAGRHREARRRLGLVAVRRAVAGDDAGLLHARVVDDDAQPGPELLQARDEVGLVQVVGENVERDRRIGQRLVQQGEDQVDRLEAHPAIDVARPLGEGEAVVGARGDDGLADRVDVGVVGKRSRNACDEAKPRVKPTSTKPA